MLDDECVETLFSCALEVYQRGEFASDVVGLFERECAHVGLDPEETKHFAWLFSQAKDPVGGREFFWAWTAASANQSAR